MKVINSRQLAALLAVSHPADRRKLRRTVPKHLHDQVEILESECRKRFDLPRGGIPALARHLILQRQEFSKAPRVRKAPEAPSISDVSTLLNDLPGWLGDSVTKALSETSGAAVRPAVRDLLGALMPVLARERNARPGD